MDKQFDLLQGLLEKARQSGADAADAILVESHSLSASQRLGRPEAIERSEASELGLRVMINQRQSIVSGSVMADDTLTELVDRAIATARAAPVDPYAGLADAASIAKSWPSIDMFDSTEPSASRLIERAAKAEDTALAVPQITNSEGGEASWGSYRVTLAASNGFAASYRRSLHGVSVVVLAGEGQGMERDYAYSSTVHECDLEDPAEVGRLAGERAVRRLNPRRPGSAALPVVYDSRVSAGLIGHLANALNGASIARGTSFLREAMDKPLFRQGITIRDDPHWPRGLRSRPFDAEGMANEPRNIVEDGHVRSWFLDLATARQLDLQSTGHASRGVSGPPSPAPTNLYLEAGAISPDELIADIGAGLYVTELMGSSVNMVTGNYSRGAGGFWIENGQISYPVSDVTVAGNLRDMFGALIPASDLTFKYATNAPTVRIDGMTVAGPGN